MTTTEPTEATGLPPAAFKCLVCDTPVLILQLTGCDEAYDATCPHRVKAAS